MELQKALELAGSINKLAAMCGVTRQSVQSWRKHGIPAAQVAHIKSSRPEWFKARKKATV